MNSINLSFGFYSEMPYGKLAETNVGKEARIKELDITSRINHLFDSFKASRTYFMLGDFLEKSKAHVGEESLKEIYNVENPLIEVSQHTQTHVIFRAISRRNDKKAVSHDEFIDDVIKANETIRKVLNTTPKGLGTPLGYHHDMSDVPKLVKRLKEIGIGYISSDLRNEQTTEGILTAQRQPHKYKNINIPDVVEIPSHGFQDTIFIPYKAKAYGVSVLSKTEIIEHYLTLFNQAKEISYGSGDIFIALCLHPWAISQYDPNLEVLKNIITTSMDKKINILSYNEIADKVRTKCA